jgi:FAD:protein FMN transferase
MPWLFMLLLPLLLLTAQTAIAQNEAAQLSRHTFTHPQMGTLFRVVLYSSDSTLARSAAATAFDRVDELNQILSDYLPDSELNRLSATAGTGQAVSVSPDLWRILELSVRASRLSRGAFDVTVGPYVTLWRRSRRQLQLPPAEALEKARQAVGFKHIRLNPRDQTVELLVPGMRLDMGGIGKGYAVDEALKVLQQHGISSALVDGGGNVAVSQPPPGRQQGWQVAIGVAGKPTHDTSHYIHLKGDAIASSGDIYQYVDLDGQRYSHILDPQTGLGLTHQREVTVLAFNGTEADWLSTALSVLDLEKGRAVIKRVKKSGARISWVEAGEVKSWDSRRFRKKMKKEKMHRR